MNLRTKILAATAAVLAVIYCIQVIISHNDGIREIKIKNGAEYISVENTSGSYELEKTDGTWHLRGSEYPADEKAAGKIADACSNIKLLQTVSKSSSDFSMERYGLDEPVRVTIRGSKNKKSLNLLIGKVSVTGLQTYIQVEGKKDIFLAQGNLHDMFSAAESSLRRTSIYNVDTREIVQVSFSDANSVFNIEKDGHGGEYSWILNKSQQLDEQKVSEWLEVLAEINASEWPEGNALKGHEPEAEIKLNAGGKKISLDIYKIESDGKSKYICTSSETTYLFAISNAKAEAILKHEIM